MTGLIILSVVIAVIAGLGMLAARQRRGPESPDQGMAAHESADARAHMEGGPPGGIQGF
jgi:hypothetical protein